MLNKNKILVVEDEPITIQGLIHTLSIENYQVDSSLFGEEALTKVFTNRDYDLILLDINLPDISGIEICRKIREEYSEIQLPIIFLSAAQNQETGFSVGANDYLNKPYSRAELLARIKLHLNLSKYFTIFHTINDALLIVSTDNHRIEDVNTRACTLFGYNREEFRTLNCKDFCENEQNFIHENFEIKLTDARSSQTQFFEWRFKNKSGKSFPVEINLERMPLMGKDHFLLIIRDITKRKEAEQKVIIFLKTIESTDQGICLLNLDGTIRYANPAFKKLVQALDFEPDTLNIRHFLKENHQLNQISDAFFSKLRERQLSAESIIRNNQGSEIPIFENIFPIFDEKDNPLFIGYAISDLTEQHQAEKNHRDALDAKSRLITMVAHELRVPMTAIKEALLIVEDEELGELNFEQRNYLEIAKKNIKRLARLVDNVLDFQKLASGKSLFTFEQYNFQDLVNEVIEGMSPLLKNRPIRLSSNINVNVPMALLDKDKIIQVLSNLINNALKFAEEGEICIRVTFDESYFYISVEDSGPGIETKDLPKIFSKFEQGSMQKTSQLKGTGLGLAICQQIINYHQGTIWVESQVGKGSTFFFSIPRHFNPEKTTIKEIEALI